MSLIQEEGAVFQVFRQTDEFEHLLIEPREIEGALVEVYGWMEDRKLDTHGQSIDVKASTYETRSRRSAYVVSQLVRTGGPSVQLSVQLSP